MELHEVNLSKMGRETESPVQYFEQEIPVWHGVRSGVFEFRYKQVLLCVRFV
jgi:hypothetical protein